MQEVSSILRCGIATKGTMLFVAVVTAVIMSIPLMLTAEDGNDTEFIFTFDSDAEGWTVGFADLPVDYDQSVYELDHFRTRWKEAASTYRGTIAATTSSCS